MNAPAPRLTSAHPTRARRALAGCLGVVALALPATLLAQPAQATEPTPPSGWSTVWKDTFDGAAGTGLDRSKWQYATGTSYPGGAPSWGTNEVETMTDSTKNVYQDGAGHLAIKPIRDSDGKWTSGRVETVRTDFGSTAGGVTRVEARLQQPAVSGDAAAGYWPAFWMLGEEARSNGATGWPRIGEVDIMEGINGRDSSFATLHCGTNPGGPCNETTGIGSGERACSGCTSGFHTYAAELDRTSGAEQLRFYRDGAVYFTVNQDRVDATTWNNALHHGFYVILNVAMGGAFPAAFDHPLPTSSTVSGQPMLVDYVAVYQK